MESEVDDSTERIRALDVAEISSSAVASFSLDEDDWEVIDY